MKNQVGVIGVSLLTLMMAGNVWAAEPQTASELYEAYIAGGHNNYHGQMTMDMEVKGEGEGFSMEIPIQMNVNMDIADVYGHGDMSMHMSMMGQSEDYSGEFYYDGSGEEAVMYTHESEDEGWVSSTDSTGIVDVQDSMLDSDLFAAGTLESSDGNYIVTLPFSALLENEEYKEVLGSELEVLDSVTSGDEEASNELMDELAKSNMVYTFDSDLNLLSIDMDDFSYSMDFQEEGMTMTLAMFMDIKYAFSDFGQINADDIRVPESVIESAGAPVDTDEEMFGGTSDTVEAPELDDVFGAVNGKPIGLEAEDFASTFGALGFEFDMESDGAYGFAVCESAEYPNVDVYVYNKSRTNTTKADIEAEGFYGYSVETEYGDKKPPMTFGGLTWGASVDDIKAVYGEATYSYDSDLYTSLEYEFSDDVSMTFYCYKDTDYDTGLQRAELTIYNW